ncbi:MAG: helix-turn-helix transcriptional regulator [Lachnospiraceae bacterium]|nr:helix-turn-helix transcriptional regulator [Lachnospiraceae bacterium]
MNHKEFGPRLKKIRRSHNLTQEQISRQLNISRQAYSNYEQGRCYPSPDILASLSIILNTNLFILFFQDAFDKHIPKACNYNLTDVESDSLIYLYSKLSIQKRTDLLSHLYEANEREVH